MREFKDPIYSDAQEITEVIQDFIESKTTKEHLDTVNVRVVVSNKLGTYPLDLSRHIKPKKKQPPKRAKAQPKKKNVVTKIKDAVTDAVSSKTVPTEPVTPAPSKETA